MRGYQRAMTIYTVHLPPISGSGNDDRARMISEAPALLALIFPALWLIWHRLWYALAAYLLLAAIVSVTAQWTANDALGGLMIIPGLYLFLEGRQLLRARLERRGWRFAGVVEAESEAEADIKWFAGEGEPVASAPPVRTSTASAPIRAPETEPSIGIFGQ